jgi:iron(III) transport system substrate-binding protein
VRRSFVALAAALGAGSCSRGPAPPPPPEVAVHARVGDAAAAVLAQAASARGVARVRLVPTAAEAEVLWLADPAEVVEAGALVEPETAPATPGVDARWGDPRGRFAPLGARARVLVLRPGAALAVSPTNVRDLADGRLAGAAVLPPLTSRAQAVALAALALAYGEASVGRFLDLLARNRALRAASDAEVVARVARGEAAVGLTGSEAAAAGALSAAGLEVVVPDQAGRGAVVLPTAVALAARAVNREPARALAAFLVGEDAERLLAARVPGFMPLRPGVPVPAGVRPAGNVVALPVDWDRLAAETRRLLPRLEAWERRTAAP